MLLLGGPLHGSEREVSNGESEVIIMAPSPGNPLPTPFKYVRRGLQAETRPGMVFQREVLVAQDMPPEMATEALGAVLLQHFANELLRQYMEGGELVESGWQFEDSAVGTSEGETESGIIIAKR